VIVTNGGVENIISMAVNNKVFICSLSHYSSWHQCSQSWGLVSTATTADHWLLLSSLKIGQNGWLLLLTIVPTHKDIRYEKFGHML